MLTLSEKLLILGLHDEEGGVVFSASMLLDYGLAGALLLELYLARRIDLTDKDVTVIDSKTTQNDLLDEALYLIVNSDKLRDAKYWLSKIHAKVKNTQTRLAEQLVNKQVLARQERSFLWVIKYNRYPTKDAQPEIDIRSHLKSIVLMDAEPSEVDVALLSLVKACQLISEVFERSEQVIAKERIDELAKGDKISKAVKQTVEEITVALIMILTTTTVVTTVTS